MFLMSFAASAFAIHAEIPSETQAVVAAGGTQITLSGEVRTRGWYLKNITPTRGIASTASAAYYDERIRLAVDAKISPNVEGFVQLESNAVQGNTNGPASGNDVYVWGNFDNKPTTLGILQSWIMYSGGGLFGFPSGVKIGHMPLALGQMEFFDHTKFGDDAIVFFMLPTKELEIDLLTIKFAGEGNTTFIPTFPIAPLNPLVGSKFSNTDDLDGYVGILTYKVDDKITVGANYTYLNQSDFRFSHQDLGLSANGMIGPVGFKAAADMQFGKVGALNQKFRGYAVLVGANMNLDLLNLRASLGYGSGDNDANDGKDKQFETYLDAVQHYTLVYDYNVITAAGRTNSGLSNTTYYNLGLDVTPMKDLTASADLYILRASEVNTAIAGSDSKNAGWEVDAKAVYKLAKNLNYQVDAGFLKAGQLYGNNKQNATVLRHMITLSF